MISKELLSEICQTNLMSLGKLEVVGSDICLYDCSMQPDIYIYMCWNIYELAHKCKEWASTHNYSVISGWEMTHWGGAYRVEVFRNSNNILFSMSTVDTEPEAIFKACQWILDKELA